MDPLSITTGIITILGALHKSVEYARKLWPSTTELQRLSLELDRLISLSNRLHRRIDIFTFQQEDLEDLNAARIHLTTAQSILSECISKGTKKRPYGIWRIERLEPSRRKDAVERFRTELAASEKDLNTALFLLTLSSVLTLHPKRVDVSAAITSDSTCLNGNPITSGESSLDQNQLNNPNSFDRQAAVHEDSGTPNGRTVSLDLLRAATHFSDGISEVISLHTAYPSPNDSSFELSPTFYPEQYVSNGAPLEQSTVYAMTEISRTSTYRVERYHLVVATDARHFKRVTVRAKIPHALDVPDSSVYGAGNYRHLLPTAFGRRLPGDVLEQVVASLKASQVEGAAIGVNLKLRKGSEDDSLTVEMEHTNVFEDLEVASTIDTSSEIDKFICQGTPVYDEGQIVRIAPAPQGFLAALGSELCLEQRMPFSGDKRHADVFMDALVSLQRAQGCRWVAKLKGVVRDESFQLSSYLLELPAQGPLRRTLYNASRTKSTISWERREKWLCQMLEAYTDIHKRALTVGANCDVCGLMLMMI